MWQFSSCFPFFVNFVPFASSSACFSLGTGTIRTVEVHLGLTKAPSKYDIFNLFIVGSFASLDGIIYLGG